MGGTGRDPGRSEGVDKDRALVGEKIGGDGERDPREEFKRTGRDPQGELGENEQRDAWEEWGDPR